MKVVSNQSVPLHVYAVTLSSLCIIIGLRWDISWHGSVGRDTFLTPPHVMVYLGAITGGLFSGIQVLLNCFSAKTEVKQMHVKIWWIFYSPLGGLFCIWGALAMLTSAPFDDWWHNAYGLDVTIASPPHTVLGLGMLAMQLGACISISKYLNKPVLPVKQKAVLRALFIIASASLVSMMTLWVSDYIDKRVQHNALFYQVIVIDVLLFLPAFGRALRMKYGMTIITLAYFFLTATTNWILQLVPATPKLAPVLNPLTHLVQLPFPLLLFIPAFAMDIIMQKIKAGDWIKSALTSVVFVGLLLVVQYPFSSFLFTSPGARNWFFGGDAWAYNMPAGWEYRYQYQPGEESSATELLAGLAIAIIAGIFITRLSLRWGSWMQLVKR